MKNYTEYRHNLEIEEDARKRAGGGTPCGHFISIGNGVQQLNNDEQIPFKNSEEIISSKMIAHFSDKQEAEEFANNIYIGEDTNIGWVRIEDQYGEMHWRFVEAIPTVEYVNTIVNGTIT